MKITKEFLKKKMACNEGTKYAIKNNLIGKNDIDVLNHLIKDNRLQWANWLIVRVMEYKQYVSYAVFAAEQVIDLYEKKYPNDVRPRKAIEAAKKCIENPSAKNKNDVVADAAAAYAAAAYAAADAAADAADAADADADAMRIKILQYGISLLEKEK